MAKLKAKVEKIEDVPEGAREFYARGTDGAFYLDAEGVDDMPAVVGLKRTRDELRAEKGQLLEKHNAAVKSLEDKIAALEKGNAGGKNDEKIAELEMRLKQVQEKAAGEIQAKDQMIEKERSALRTAYRRSTIATALAKFGGNPDFLMHLIEPHVKVDLDGEAYRVSVVDSTGNPRIKSSAEPTFTVDDLVAEMRANQKYKPAFTADPSHGGGEKGSDTGGGPVGSGDPKTIKSNDPNIGKFVKQIAKGEVKVVSA